VRLANTPEGLAAFVRHLGEDGLVVCEATGGHETALLLAVLDAGVSVHRAGARKLKAFIRSRGTLGKTDVIDAQALVRYGQERHAELPRWQPAGEIRDTLRTLARLRTQLVKQRAALTNQIKAARSLKSTCRP
jgi:transposase